MSRGMIGTMPPAMAFSIIRSACRRAGCLWRSHSRLRADRSPWARVRGGPFSDRGNGRLWLRYRHPEWLMARCAVLSLLGFLAALPSSLADEAPTDRAGEEFFERNIRPLLVAQCYECHSAEGIKRSGRKSPGGNLLLDTRQGLRSGGDLGPAVVPGKPDESLIVTAVRHSDKDLKMPPSGKLPASAIASIEAWVKMGAPDPRAASTPAAGATTNIAWPDVLRQ